MRVESTNTKNGIINLDIVANIAKNRDHAIMFTLLRNFVWWEYETKEERDNEYNFIKLMLNPSSLRKYNS